jgi:hypothetical protein
VVRRAARFVAEVHPRWLDHWSGLLKNETEQAPQEIENSFSARKTSGLTVSLFVKQWRGYYLRCGNYVNVNLYAAVPRKEKRVESLDTPWQKEQPFFSF